MTIKQLHRIISSHLARDVGTSSTLRAALQPPPSTSVVGRHDPLLGTLSTTSEERRRELRELNERVTNA